MRTNAAAPTGVLSIEKKKKKRLRPKKTQALVCAHMAALPLCASWFPPSSGIAVASHTARPASRVTHIHSLGRRRGPSLSPLPIRIQAPTRASHLRCPKAADPDHGLEKPKPERGDIVEPDEAASTEEINIPFLDLIPSSPRRLPLERGEFRKAFRARWLQREAPDMFRMEKDEILNYMRICRHAKVQDVNKKLVALFVCTVAQEALDLASMVMDLPYVESLDRGTIRLFDQRHTANQVIRVCTPIFCDVAKTAYLNRIETDTVLSFLDALRDLGVFCDMLCQQIVFKLKDGPRKNSIRNAMGFLSRNFDKEMKSLKEQFIPSTDVFTGINRTAVLLTLSEGMMHTEPYILQMILAQEHARRLLDRSKRHKKDGFRENH